MKKQKSFIIWLMALLLVLAFSASALAAPSIGLNINSKDIKFNKDDQPPTNVNDRVLVPMRKIFEELDMRVVWDAEKATVVGSNSENIVIMRIGDKKAYVNDKIVTLDVPAKLINGRTMVPARFVAESIGAYVDWDGKNQKVVIKTKGSTSKPDDNKNTLTPKEISEKYSDAVCYIGCFDAAGRMFSAGSGFVSKSDGVVITNYHVIEGAHSVFLLFPDGREYTTNKVLNYNVEHDMAALKVDAENLKTVTFGDSDSISTGDKVYAIGSPQGLDNTISDGIISNKNRKIDGTSYFQHTAPMSEGSSGGPLFDAYGKVVGINTAYFEGGQNLNLSVKINDARKYIEKSNIVLMPLGGETPGDFNPSELSDFAKSLPQSYTQNGKTVNFSNIVLELMEDGDLYLEFYFYGDSEDAFWKMWKEDPEAINDWLLAQCRTVNAVFDKKVEGYISFSEEFESLPDKYKNNKIFKHTIVQEGNTYYVNYPFIYIYLVNSQNYSSRWAQ